jgi:hypothetical protein
MKSRTVVSLRKSPHFRMVVARRTDAGAPAELGNDVEGVVLGEEPVLGDERLASEAHPDRRSGVQVAHPVGVRTPSGDNDGLVRVGVVPQHHRDDLVLAAGLASGMDEFEEGPTE